MKNNTKRKHKCSKCNYSSNFKSWIDLHEHYNHTLYESEEMLNSDHARKDTSHKKRKTCNISSPHFTFGVND